MIVPLVFSLLFITHSDCARILGIVPTASVSHQVVFQPIWRELSLRGHQVTVITTDPMKDPTLTNLTEIDISGAYVYMKKINMAGLTNKTKLGMMLEFKTNLDDMLVYILEYPEVQELIKDETKQFDVVMVESLNNVMYSFSVRFDCPLIGILSVDGFSKIFREVGNPDHPIVYPDFSLPYTVNLTFLERVHSFFYYYYSYFLWEWLINFNNQELIRTYFGTNYPTLTQLGARIQVLFLNTDTVFHPVRPLLPNVVQIGGGTHLKPPKPLPTDLQTELDSATQGVIYFSLGSNVKSKDLTNEQRAVFLETFAELPYKVLWKFELEDLPGKPPNVVISKWFPQGDVLRHPNVKVFITQGGLQSSEESIYAHVPMVGIPFFGDQPKNVQRMVDRGIGLRVHVAELEKETLKKAITEVMTNTKYMDRVKYLVELAKDQPMTGLEKAIWWTEYVIRHKGATHLRSPLLDIPWYQYYLLDVIGFCTLVVFGSLYFITKTVIYSIKLTKWILCCRKLKND